MKSRTLKMAVLSLPLFFIAAHSASAQQIERSYPGNGCTAARNADLFPDEAGGVIPFADRELDMYSYSTTGAVSAASTPGFFLGGGQANDNNGIVVYCPVQREKVGASETAGAKFFAYFNRQAQGAIGCTLTSAKAHNGVIVASASRSIADGVGSNGLQTLTRSTGPANGWGPYSLRCQVAGVSSGIGSTPSSLYSYRIREF